MPLRPETVAAEFPIVTTLLEPAEASEAVPPDTRCRRSRELGPDSAHVQESCSDRLNPTGLGELAELEPHRDGEFCFQAIG